MKLLSRCLRHPALLSRCLRHPALLSLLLPLTLALTLPGQGHAEDNPWLSQSDLVARLKSGPSPELLAFGEVSTLGYRLQPPAKDSKPGDALDVDFSSEVFFIVSNFDGWLAAIMDASEAYPKAWKLHLESKAPGDSTPLKVAELALKTAQNERDQAVALRLSKTGDSPQVTAMDLEIKRLDAAARAAQKAVDDLKRAIEDAHKVVSRGFQELGVNCRLRLGRETFDKLAPADLVRMIDADKSLFLLRFSLRNTNQDKDAWLRLLKDSPMNKVHGEVTLAFTKDDGRESILAPKGNAGGYHLSISLFRWPFWTSFAVIAAFLFVFVQQLRNTGMLRDSSITIINRKPGDRSYWHRNDHPLSIGRLQMSIWFFVIIISFVYLWSTTGSLAGVNATAFALMGISGGTTMVSAFVTSNQVWDASQRAQNGNGKSEASNWLLDLLSDENGPTIHRFQMLAWTLVLSVVFINGVLSEYAMPVFSNELLGLMGISSGVYVGFKMKEGKPEENTDTSAAPDTDNSPPAQPAKPAKEPKKPTT